MNTGQTLLVIGAIVLLFILTLSAVQAQFDHDRVQDETRIGIRAISLCSDKLDSLSALPFDALVPGNYTDTTTTSIGTFICKTQVGYIQDGYPDSLVVGPTFLKQIRVGITNPYLPGQVTQYGVVGDY